MARSKTAPKLLAFAVALAAAFGGGAALGGAVGPIDVGGDDEHLVEHTPASIGPTPTTEPAPHDEPHGWGDTHG